MCLFTTRRPAGVLPERPEPLAVPVSLELIDDKQSTEADAAPPAEEAERTPAKESAHEIFVKARIHYAIVSDGFRLAHCHWTLPLQKTLSHQVFDAGVEGKWRRDERSTQMDGIGSTRCKHAGTATTQPVRHLAAQLCARIHCYLTGRKRGSIPSSDVYYAAISTW